ncbi:hypothetical protein HPB51_024272 [Rhipicephalus microplus]|uniref:Uncharacterized protein n=1 Tax=Rhipicephalus microplus TaxID=6941 RepID=A0A9J6EIZ2_RHIMP|nr:hypothetical protein HPB51_024272 [Rhipicephalus microplus]
MCRPPWPPTGSVYVERTAEQGVMMLFGIALRARLFHFRICAYECVSTDTPAIGRFGNEAGRRSTYCAIRQRGSEGKEEASGTPKRAVPPGPTPSGRLITPAAYRRPKVMALLSRRGTPGRGLIRSVAPPTLEREGSRRMGCSQGPSDVPSYMKGARGGREVRGVGDRTPRPSSRGPLRGFMGAAPPAYRKRLLPDDGGLLPATLL